MARYFAHGVLTSCALAADDPPAEPLPELGLLMMVPCLEELATRTPAGLDEEEAAGVVMLIYASATLWGACESVVDLGRDPAAPRVPASGSWVRAGPAGPGSEPA